MRTVDRDSSESTPLESGTFHVFSTDVDYSYLLGSKMGFRRQQLPRHTFYSVLTNSLTESMGWPNIKIQRTVVIITERCVSCFPPLILSVRQIRRVSWKHLQPTNTKVRIKLLSRAILNYES
jgi:hypothetical protein